METGKVLPLMNGRVSRCFSLSVWMRDIVLPSHGVDECVKCFPHKLDEDQSASTSQCKFG